MTVIDYSSLVLEERMRCFYSMASDNPALLDFLGRAKIGAIPHIDSKCVIFSLAGDTSRTLKYVVDPLTKEKLSPRIQAIVLRGLKNQAHVQYVPGVQRLHSVAFYEGIEGLVGPFRYLEGFNLAHADPCFVSSPEEVLSLFQEQLDLGVLSSIHGRKILHRDVKPGNIVYSHGRLYLIDWSISVNFTESLRDIDANRSLGTPGFITYDLDRSHDFFALAVTFAKVLCPELELKGPFEIYAFENHAKMALDRRFGREFRDYFSDLAHRPSEIDFSSLPMGSSREGFGIDPRYSFGVGTTYHVEHGPLSLQPAPSSSVTWIQELPSAV